MGLFLLHIARERRPAGEISTRPLHWATPSTSLEAVQTRQGSSGPTVRSTAAKSWLTTQSPTPGLVQQFQQPLHPVGGEVIQHVSMQMYCGTLLIQIKTELLTLHIRSTQENAFKSIFRFLKTTCLWSASGCKKWSKQI